MNIAHFRDVVEVIKDEDDDEVDDEGDEGDDEGDEGMLELQDDLYASSKGMGDDEGDEKMLEEQKENTKVFHIRRGNRYRRLYMNVLSDLTGQAAKMHKLAVKDGKSGGINEALREAKLKMEQDLADLKTKNAEDLAAKEALLSTAVADAAKLSVQYASVAHNNEQLADACKQWAVTLEQQRVGFEGALAAERKTAADQYTTTYNQHTLIQEGMRDAHATAIADLRKEHATAIAALRDAHATAIADLRKEHAGMVKNLRQENSGVIETYRSMVDANAIRVHASQQQALLTNMVMSNSNQNPQLEALMSAVMGRSSNPAPEPALRLPLPANLPRGPPAHAADIHDYADGHFDGR